VPVPVPVPGAPRKTAFPPPPSPGKADPTLSMAVLVYLGVGISSSPTRLPDRLFGYFGPEHADALQRRVDVLLDESWLAPDEWAGLSLGAATDRLEESLRLAHPELSEAAVQAVGWAFSFNNR